jgi:iron complex outermembrane receptor protein
MQSIHLWRCAVIIASLTASTVNAQTTNDEGLEELVVTAQRRAENIQIVPVSITAFTGQGAAALGIAKPLDLQAQTPGLFVKTTAGDSAPIFYIRGIGLNDFFANNNPSASVYVDQVLQPFHPMLNFAIFDAERIEVLKGPQGTLYGRNNTAGAINFITNKPTDTFEGYVNADYGNYSDRRVEAAVGGPIAGSTLTGRLAFYARRSDGFQTNEFTGQDVGGSDVWATRGLLRWRPTDVLGVLINVHGGQDRGEDQWYKLVNSQNPKHPSQTCAPALAGELVYNGSCTDVAGHYDPDPNIDHVGGTNPFFGTKKNNRTYGASITADVRLLRATLTSISSYDWFRRYEPISADGTPHVTVNTLFDEHIWAAAQELRLTSDESWPFEWIAGVFLSRDAIGGSEDLQADDFLPLVTGIPAPIAAVQAYEQRTRSYAAFGQTHLTLADQWHLVAGLRETEERKHFVGGSTFVQAYVNDIPLTHTDDSIRANDVSGKLALQYFPLDKVMFYASLDKGFKSGGYNAAFSTNPVQLAPYGPEKLYSFEIGEKSTLFDNTLTLDGAIYNYWWRNLQASIVATSNNIPVQVLTNAGNARVYGFEAEAAWRPLAGLKLQLNGNLLHTRITSGQYEGGGLSNAPKGTAGALAQYEAPLFKSELNWIGQLDGNYRSAVRFALGEEVPALGEQKGFALLNGRIGVAEQNDRWRVAIWVRNITDRRYLVETFDQTPINLLQVWNVPRTYGINLYSHF